MNQFNAVQLISYSTITEEPVPSSSVTRMLEKLNLPLLSDRRTCNRMITMFKIFNGIIHVLIESIVAFNIMFSVHWSFLVSVWTIEKCFPTHAIMLYYTINVSHIVTFVPDMTINTILIQVNHIIRVIQCMQHLGIITFALMQLYNY